MQSIVRNINGGDCVLVQWNECLLDLRFGDGHHGTTDSEHAEHDSRVAGNISVSGVNGGPWSVTFVNKLANTDVAQIGTNNNNANVSVETQGAGPLADQIGNVNVDIAKSGLHQFWQSSRQRRRDHDRFGSACGHDGQRSRYRVAYLIGAQIDSGTGTFGVNGNPANSNSCRLISSKFSRRRDLRHQGQFQFE